MYGSTNIDFDSVVVIRKTRREVNAAMDGSVSTQLKRIRLRPIYVDLSAPAATAS